MPNNGSFKRVLAQAFQQVSATEPVRIGQYKSYAIQEMLRELLRYEIAAAVPPAPATFATPGGFFADGFFVEGIAGSFDVRLRDGWGFQYDATGVIADESAYRVLQLTADTVISTGGAPPAAGTYYVFVRWGSIDGQNEIRQVRPAPGAAFAGAGTNTAHIPSPSIVWQAGAALPGYSRIATVVVPALPADSLAYTYKDERVSLTAVTRIESLVLSGAIEAPMAGGSWGYVNAAVGWLAAGNNPLHLDVQVMSGSGVAADELRAINVYGITTGAGDNLTVDVRRLRPGVGDASLATAPVALGGATAGWVRVPLTGSYLATDRVYVQMKPTFAAGVQVLAAYAERRRRYLAA